MELEEILDNMKFTREDIISTCKDKKFDCKYINLELSIYTDGDFIIPDLEIIKDNMRYSEYMYYFTFIIDSIDTETCVKDIYEVLLLIYNHIKSIDYSNTKFRYGKEEFLNFIKYTLILSGLSIDDDIILLDSEGYGSYDINLKIEKLKPTKVYNSDKILFK